MFDLTNNGMFGGPSQAAAGGTDLLAALSRYLPPQPAIAQPVAAVPAPYEDIGGFGPAIQSNPQTVAGAPGMMDSFNSWLKSSGFLGSTDANGLRTDGWGGMAVGAAGALMNAVMGSKQLKVAKDSLSESKRQFDMNYGAQRQTVNTRLEDRQRARVASNAGAYESVGTYMDKNRVR